MEKRPDFRLVWKGVVVLCLTAIGELIVSDIFQLSLKLQWIYLFTFILLLLISVAITQFIWIYLSKISKKVNQSIKTPKIKHWFELSKINDNDLKLYIKNESNSIEAFVECWNKDLLTLDHIKYIHAYPNVYPDRKLDIVRSSLTGHFPLLGDTLKCNDTRQIQVGISFKGKIALRFYDQDSPVSGFVDGVFEYIVSCGGKCLGIPYNLPDFSVFLTIKNGALVQIRDKL